MKTEFLNAISAHSGEFGLEITDEKAERLGDYYAFLLGQNPVLHLVAPCEPEEFAVRHILESLYVSALIPKSATVADAGSGGGLPGVPLAIGREDLKVILIESKEKKAAFLKEVVERCGISDRVRVIGRQFSETTLPKGTLITARALDKFTKILPKLLKWASGRRMILFGGPSLEEALVDADVKFQKKLIPTSEQRFVFEVRPNRNAKG